MQKILRFGRRESLRKLFFIGMIVCFLIMFTACKDETQESDVEETAEEEVDVDEEDELEKPDEENVEEFVKMSADVHVDEDKIVVEGQSNLPEDASLRSRAVANNWA